MQEPLEVELVWIWHEQNFPRDILVEPPFPTGHLGPLVLRRTHERHEALIMPFKSKVKAEEWRLQWRIRNRDKLRAQRLAWEERNQDRLKAYRERKKSCGK